MHVKIHPQPASISESRQVLKVLESYGDVVFYKHLKYEPQASAPHRAIVIFKIEKAARTALDASPIRFWYNREGDKDDIGFTKSDDGERPTSDEIGAGKGVPSGTGSKTDEFPESLADQKQPTSVLINTSGEILNSMAQSPVGIENGKWRKSFSSLERNSLEWKKWDKPSIAPPTPIQSSQIIQTPAPSLRREVLPQTLTDRLPQSTISHRTFPLSTPARLREVQLTLSPSITNHDAYISRQGYYSAYEPARVKSIMATDLGSRVPSRGFADLRINMPEVSLKMRKARTTEERERVRQGGVAGGESLTSIYEQGIKEHEANRAQKPYGFNAGMVREKSSPHGTAKEKQYDFWRPLRHERDAHATKESDGIENSAVAERFRNVLASMDHSLDENRQEEAKVRRVRSTNRKPDGVGDK